MSQQPPSPPPDQGPYGQPGAAPRQPGFSQPGYPGYPDYAVPARSLDLAKLVFIAGWIVLGLYGLAYFYDLAQSDDGSPDFADRLFYGMPQLALGIFYAGVLLAVSRWLEKQKQAP